MQFDGGKYLESVYQPFVGVLELADLDRSHFPSADWFDYSTVASECKKLVDAGYAVCIGWRVIWTSSIPSHGRADLSRS